MQLIDVFEATSAQPLLKSPTVKQLQHAAWMYQKYKTASNRNDPELINRMKYVYAILFAGNQISLRHIPVSMWSTELALEAIQRAHNRKKREVIEMMPEHLKTKQFYYDAVRLDGDLLFCIPVQDRIPEICLAAVKQDGYAIQYVPKILLQVYDICLAAVKQNSGALRYVPTEHMQQQIKKELGLK